MQFKPSVYSRVILTTYRPQGPVKLHSGVQHGSWGDTALTNGKKKKKKRIDFNKVGEVVGTAITQLMASGSGDQAGSGGEDDQSGDNKQTEEKDNTMMIAGLALGGLALVSTVGFFLIRKKPNS